MGKSVTDLQSNIVIGGDSTTGRTISGKSKKVTGYTGFSGDVSEQSGNYVAVHCAVPNVDDVTITFELVGGALGHPVTLDDDGLMIMRLTNVETQYIKLTASKTGYETVTQIYSLAGVELLSA